MFILRADGATGGFRFFSLSGSRQKFDNLERRHPEDAPTRAWALWPAQELEPCQGAALTQGIGCRGRRIGPMNSSENHGAVPFRSLTVVQSGGVASAGAALPGSTEPLRPVLHNARLNGSGTNLACFRRPMHQLGAPTLASTLDSVHNPFSISRPGAAAGGATGATDLA